MTPIKPRQSGGQGDLALRHHTPFGSALFLPGRIVATPGVLDAFQDNLAEASVSLRRHLIGDWGDLCDEDKRANAYALKTGERLLSAYHTSSGVKFYIITEADRSATTFLLPEEY